MKDDASGGLSGSRDETRDDGDSEDEPFAVEVKYQEKITKDDFASLYHFGDGVIASKSSIELDEPYSVIPVHLLLAVI